MTAVQQLNKEIKEVKRDDEDFTQFDVGYAPGMVQKLRAKYSQLSKETITIPSSRLSRFKRRKISAENNYAITNENHRIDNASKNTDMNGARCGIEKNNLNFNDLVRFSITSENQQVNQIHSWQLSNSNITNNNKAQNKKTEFIQVQQIEEKMKNGEENEGELFLPPLSSTVRVVVELTPNEENPSMPLIVQELPATTSTSSSISKEFQQKKEKNLIKMAGNEWNDESTTDRLKQLRLIPNVGNISTGRAQMPIKRPNKGDGLEEVHRLLQKFNTIREQRAGRAVCQDVAGNSDRQNSTTARSLQQNPILKDDQSYPFTTAVLQPEMKINATKTTAFESQEMFPKSQEEKDESQTNVEENVEGSPPPLASIVTKVPEQENDDKSGGFDKVDEQSKSEVDGQQVTDNINSSSSITNNTQNNKLSPQCQRKSLVAQHLEEKIQGKQNKQTEKVPELQPYNTNYANDMNKGPVRQSLLNLVLAEDVPALMEAMAEKLEFVFEDLTPSGINAVRGILRNSTNPGRPRSKVKETKLEFNASPPTVFTYPDEETAVEESQWEDGEQITYKVYQKLCQKERELSERINCNDQRPLRPSQITTNTEFPLVRTVSLLEEPSMAESLLGVTGRISYNSVPINLTRLNENPVSLIASK